MAVTISLPCYHPQIDVKIVLQSQHWVSIFLGDVFADPKDILEALHHKQQC